MIKSKLKFTINLDEKNLSLLADRKSILDKAPLDDQTIDMIKIDFPNVKILEVNTIAEINFTKLDFKVTL